MTVAPQPGTRVGLQLACCGPRLHPSRVTGASGEALHVDAPREHPSGAPGAPVTAGDAVVVGWHTEGGWVDAAATVEAAPDDGQWVLRLAPMTATTERRQHLRVAESSAVEVDTDGDVAAGRIIDLSETGMRCVVAPHRTLEVGDEIVVVFVLDTGSVALDADVVRAATAGGGTEVGLRFHPARRRDVSRIRDHVAGRLARMTGGV